jgi:hypothetical protein
VLLGAPALTLTAVAINLRVDAAATPALPCRTGRASPSVAFACRWFAGTDQIRLWLIGPGRGADRSTAHGGQGPSAQNSP